jgi:crotonobetainyl-CoA:carnitine CoA-transferase CaiB-like acyl-CoA transferase
MNDRSLTSRAALAGVRVLDLTRLIPGPMATLVLADLGAQIDKLEDPAPGDYMRNMPPLRGTTGGCFHALNRDKRSVVVDLKSPAGVALLRRMIPPYDVVLEGFRPGVLARLGCSHDDMLALNPRLVVCAITGYGQTGPLAHRAGHDLNYLARAGVLGITGPADEPPSVSGAQMADVAGGALWAVIAVLAALRERDRTGRGSVCDIAMCEGAVPLGAFALGAITAGARVAPRGRNHLDGGIAPYNTYRTSDGGYVSLGALEPKFWTNFAVAAGVDPSLDALFAGEHQIALKARLIEVFATRTRAEWEAFARAHDCCLEPVLEASELAKDPQHEARGVFFDLDDGAGAAIPVFRTPVGAGAAVAHTAAREPGADTAAVLRDAGLTDDEVSALMRDGVVR